LIYEIPLIKLYTFFKIVKKIENNWNEVKNIQFCFNNGWKPVEIILNQFGEILF